jgi:hypothetical protein
MDRVVGGAVASGLPQIDVPLKEIVLERRRVEYAYDLSSSHDFLVVVHEPLCCSRWHRSLGSHGVCFVIRLGVHEWRRVLGY